MLVVDDINDNFPEIDFPVEMAVIHIKEETFATIFTSSELIVDDIDLGPNASYEVLLSKTESAAVEYSNAFNVIPTNGYQRQGFTVTVTNTSLIDYEDVDWQEFEIMVSA